MLQDKIVKNQEITDEEGIRSLKSHGKLQGKTNKKTDMRFKGFCHMLSTQGRVIWDNETAWSKVQRVKSLI